MKPIILNGTVVHGNHLGATIDMPTANIYPLEDITNLPKGVYYSKVSVDGKSYKAITNIGTKPTVKSDNAVNAESYLYDFSGDLYGKDIIVELVEFRRPEMKFDSFEQLTNQMHQDMEAGQNFLQKITK
ncbi:MAG: riboflavin kinase [Lachnospiraceae bacterium]|nr:riboflavin kinase [Lachnospiraceae bacterium]